MASLKTCFNTLTQILGTKLHKKSENHAFLLANILLVCQFYIILINNGIVEGCIYANMTKKTLHLLDGHTLIYSHCCKCASELVGMDFSHGQLFAKFANTHFNTAYCQSAVWCFEGNK